MNPGSKYVRALGPTFNNGTITGGLAHALTQGLEGYAEMKEKRDAELRQREKQSQLADFLRGMNRRAIGPIDERGAMGPTVEAGHSSPFGNPDLLAALAIDPETAPLAHNLIGTLAKGPKTPEPFTLNAGQTRYGSDGQVIASAPVARNAPSGFAFDQDDRLIPIPGGPADPAYISQVAPLRRPQTTFNMMPGETEFMKLSGKNDADYRASVIEAGQNAVGTEQTFRQLGDLLGSGVRTGSLQPAVAALQGIAEDMGVDMSGTAQALGIELGDLAEAQNFNRLATQVVIDGFEQFKGNLNQREVEIAERAFGGLGTTPEANADAIAAGIAASQIARERAVMASRAKTQADVRALQESLISGDVAEFENRKAAIKAKLLEGREGELPTIQGDADYDALPPGTQFRAPDGSIRVKP